MRDNCVVSVVFSCATTVKLIAIYAIKITIARILFPNYYFNLYDLIIQNKTNEKEIINITKKSNEFEIYIKNIILYFSKFYKITPIEWILKK